MLHGTLFARLTKDRQKIRPKKDAVKDPKI